MAIIFNCFEKIFKVQCGTHTYRDGSCSLQTNNEKKNAKFDTKKIYVCIY